MNFNCPAINRILFFLIIGSLWSLNLQAQCPTDITFTSQYDLDQFAIEYPNCTHIEGSLTIRNASQGNAGNIEDLSALSNLKIIEGTLMVIDTYDQTPDSYNGLQALSNLESVGSWHQSGTDLKMLSPDLNFQVQDEFIFYNNKDLSSLANISFSDTLKTFELRYSWALPADEVNKLSNVKYIETFDMTSTTMTEIPASFDIEIGSSFVISYMEDLVHFDGLRFNDSLAYLTILHCKALNTDLSAFNTLEHIVNLRIDGTDDMTRFPEFASLQTIHSIDMMNYPDEEDLSVFENVNFTGRVIRLAHTGITTMDGLRLNDETDYYIYMIYNENLVDIDVLDGLTTLGKLEIWSSPSLTNFEPLQSVETIICELVLQNIGINSLRDFSNLNSVSILELFSLANIETLEGFESLQSIGQELRVQNLTNLTNFNGLENVHSIGFDKCINAGSLITIKDNPKLESIYALSNANNNASFLYIQDNPQLAACSIMPICQRLSNPSLIMRINDNSDGCNSIEEVIEDCNFNRVSIFFDKDENQIQSNGEQNIPIGKLNVDDKYTLIPSNAGNFGYFDDGNISFVEYVEDENWNTTTDQTIYDLTDTLSSFENSDIGIYPKTFFDRADAYLAFNNIICGSTYGMVAVVKNTGTTFLDLNVFIEGHGSFVRSNPIPIDSLGSEYIYKIENLAPGATSNIYVVYEAATVGDVALGTNLDLKIRLNYLDTSGDLVGRGNNYVLPFLCSYDPNDKQVFPAGLYDENYTLFEEEELQYLIRFQNTGNFPAQDIVIRDTLDGNLDLSTFEFIHSSHPISQIKLERNVVDFVFDNIYLPDSINNEPDSHGFVSFSIKTQENLDENTKIENTAYIYFDSNPAIITNTVFNTYVSEYPTISATHDTHKWPFRIYPNPTSDLLYIDQSDRSTPSSYTIYNTQGKLVQQGNVDLSSNGIDTGTLEEGMYLLKINEQAVKFVKL